MEKKTLIDKKNNSVPVCLTTTDKILGLCVEEILSLRRHIWKHLVNIKPKNSLVTCELIIDLLGIIGFKYIQLLINTLSWYN